MEAIALSIQHSTVWHKGRDGRGLAELLYSTIYGIAADSPTTAMNSSLILLN